MSLPNSSNKIWLRVISGQISVQYESLSTRIVLSRINLKYKLKPSEEMLKKGIEELRGFFEANKNIPTIKADFEKIFGKGEL